MPIWSDTRKRALYSTREVAQAWCKSDRTVRLWASRPGVFTEVIAEVRPDGGSGKGGLYFDVDSLIPVFGHPVNPLPKAEAPAPVNAAPLVAAAPPLEPYAPRPLTPLPDLRQANPEELAWATRVDTLARELVAVPRGGGRLQRLQAFAKQEGVTLKTAYQWLADLERNGVLGLVKLKRADAGKSLIPPETESVLMSLWLHHPNASAGRIRRLLELGAPELLTYRHGSGRRTLSERGIRDVRRRMEADPRMRVALMDEDQRREFLRTWAGRVVAEHANDLWEVDFTRCDVFVFDPQEYWRTGKLTPYRLRIHAALDVASGCVPAMVHSRLESQQPTSRMFTLAMLPKPEVNNWHLRWPIWGRPRRVYSDNGKVYLSETTLRGLNALQIEHVRSRAWVSHTRGAIERFFETFHQGFERALPGYAGEDASRRSSWELERLTRNTLRWLEAGAPADQDPGPDRLLSEAEYMQQALLWLTMDYHKQALPGGKSREELWRQSVPQSSLVQFSLIDLFKIFSTATERTVAGNGTIRYNNVSNPQLKQWAFRDRTMHSTIRFPQVRLAYGSPAPNAEVQGCDLVRVVSEPADSALERALGWPIGPLGVSTARAFPRAISGVNEHHPDPAPGVDAGIGSQHRGPLLLAEEENPPPAGAPRSGTDPVAPQKTLVAPEGLQVGLHLLQAHGRVGHELVEALHQQRLGEYGELGQRAGLEAPVEPLVEGRTRVGVAAQGLEALRLVGQEALAAPTVVLPQPPALEQHPDKQRGVHGAPLQPCRRRASLHLRPDRPEEVARGDQQPPLRPQG